LRNALTGVLTGLTTTAGRVFANPPRVLQETDLPALVLRDGPEEIVEMDSNGAPARTIWRLQLDLVAKTAADGIALIDAMIDETLLAILSASPTFAALDADCTWQGGSGNLEIDSVADKPVYVYPIALEIHYLS
jgi:hypothetical protein